MAASIFFHKDHYLDNWAGATLFRYNRISLTANGNKYFPIYLVIRQTGIHLFYSAWNHPKHAKILSLPYSDYQILMEN